MSGKFTEDFSFSHMTVPQVLERFDNLNVRDGDYLIPWGWFLRVNGLTEYPTVEYTGKLSQYLAERSEEIAAKNQNPARIAEIAAGTGMLSLLLSKELEAIGSDAEIVASDDGSWRTRPLPHVKIEDYRITLEREQPDIVIGSWLPGDFTPDIRQSGAEYVLIGATGANGGLLHGTQSTWGRDELGQPLEWPDYAKDGYVMEPLPDMQEYQLCYRSYSTNLHPSETVVFRQE